MNADSPPARGPWWRELNRYHWFVFLVAALGWLFDCLDQQLFLAARVPAMRDLLHTTDMKVVTEYGGYATSIFLAGWGAGGLIFGVLGDRIGRAKTMVLTILIYSICTGLSAFSTGFWDFALYRFLTGLGVGGEWAVGVALIAEVMPDRARPHALGLLQTLSTIGNVAAALVSIGIGHLETTGRIQAAGGWGWRIMFLVGAVPALLALVIRRRLKEPERWQAVVAQGAVRRAGSYAELFGNARLRRNALFGVVLASVGVIGLWGILFFSIDLIRAVLRQGFVAEGFAAGALAGKLSHWTGIALIMMNVGAFVGLYSMSHITEKIGRRAALGLAFVLAMLSTAAGFWYLNDVGDVFWLIPLMGCCQFAMFSLYAIYLPELFPTHLRSTGVSFCYNVGRLVAAVGPLTAGLLTSRVFNDHPEPMPLRLAGITLCAVFLIGLLVLPFAPETRGTRMADLDREG